MDENKLYLSEDIEISALKDEKLKKCFLPSKFCLISSDGHTYGPFGTDSIGRTPVTIQIGNGDVLAQTTSSFIYHLGYVTFKSAECFSFYVRNEISGVADVSRAETLVIQ